MMESSRVSVSASGKRNAALESLRSENSKLKEDVMLENKYTSSMLSLNSNAAMQINKLQEQADQYTRRIELEKRRVAELDRTIGVMQARIEEQRRKMGGVNAARENNQQVQKHIKILENRLDKALQRYNEAVAHNRSLRSSIDDLRRERLVFEGIYRKLERELAEKRKELGSINEAAAAATEARDAAVSELARLKLQAEREQQGFEQEWRELGRTIEQERRMRDQLKSKRLGKINASAGAHGAGPQKPGSAPSGDQRQATNFTWQDVEAKRKQNTQAGWIMAKDKAAQQMSTEKVQSYSEAFLRITEATGIADVDVLVATFVNAEDENYRLFKYVEEVNQEVAKLEEQIVEVRAEIDRCKGHGASADSARKRILSELEERLHKTEAKAEVYEQARGLMHLRHTAAMKTVDALRAGIQTIFSKVGCATLANKELLGEGGVTEANMMQYLGIIEHRTNEILQEFAQMHAAAQGSASGHLQAAVLGVGPAVPVGAAAVAIEPPSIAEEDAEDLESIDDEEGPLTRDQLMLRTEQSLRQGFALGAADRTSQSRRKLPHKKGPF